MAISCAIWARLLSFSDRSPVSAQYGWFRQSSSNGSIWLVSASNNHLSLGSFGSRMGAPTAFGAIEAEMPEINDEASLRDLKSYSGSSALFAVKRHVTRCNLKRSVNNCGSGSLAKPRLIRRRRKPYYVNKASIFLAHTLQVPSVALAMPWLPRVLSACRDHVEVFEHEQVQNSRTCSFAAAPVCVCSALMWPQTCGPLPRRTHCVGLHVMVPL